MTLTVLPGDLSKQEADWGQFGYRKLLYVKVIFCTSELW